MNPASGLQSLHLPSRRGLLGRLAAALLAAAVILGGFILPAEYHLDPTGFGQAMGLMAISAPPPPDTPADPALGAAVPADSKSLARTYRVPFRTDTVKIPLKPDGELEYKVKMQPGGTLVYSWSVDKGMVYWDFHGEPPDDPKKAQSYGIAIGSQAHGSLIAPFAGIHGWFLQNQEGHPVVVTVHMSGFYELREEELSRQTGANKQE